jgi:integrase/recombinase XerD
LIPPDVAQELFKITNGNPQYVFWNNKGGSKRSTVTKWHKDLHRVFVKAGMRNGHPHQLRHRFAADMLSKGMPLEEVSKLPGHKAVKTTEKYYAKWVKSRQDRLDNLVIATWKENSAT